MKKRVIRLVLIGMIFLAAILFTVFLDLFGKDVSFVENCKDVLEEKNSYYDAETGVLSETTVFCNMDEDIAGIRITDVEKIGRIGKINYFPDEFLSPQEPMKGGTIVNLVDGDFRFAERGTLQLVVLGPRPPYVREQEKLQTYRKGDYWRLTLGIPPIFSACNVYYGGQIVATAGEIANYDFIKYTTSDDTVTRSHSPKTEYSYVDMKFYAASDRGATGGILPHENLVTIHYETKFKGLSAIKDCPVIGLKEEVLKRGKLISQPYAVASVIAGIVLSVFLFLVILKRTASFVPQLLMVAGIFALFISGVFLRTATKFPAFLTAVNATAPVPILFACLLSVTRVFKSKTLKRILLAVCCVTAVLTFVIPYISRSAAKATGVAAAAVLFAGCLFLFGAVIFSAVRGTDGIYKYVSPLLIAVATASAIIVRNAEFTLVNSLYWIMLDATLIAFAVILKIFTDLERNNRYLTSNLRTEVDIRTRELVGVVEDRNKLLRFISHDLRKPLDYSARTLDKIKKNEKDGENVALIDSLLIKNREADESLKQIADFSRHNFRPEGLKVLDVKKFLAEIYESVKPDCDAGGVFLRLDAVGNRKVYGKEESLKSALINIILNALEHSECSVITLSVRKRGPETIIGVEDDGKGIASEADIFQPYVSAKGAAGRGLGLYISKQAVKAMNGNLTYTSRPGFTAFYISLPEYRE